MPSWPFTHRRKRATLQHRGKASAIGFPGAPGRQLLGKVKHIRLLVFFEPPGEEGAQLARRELSPGNDERVDALAQPLVGPADGERGRDVGMRAARELDLERRDLVAAAVDQLLLAPDDLDHAGVALAREVAGARADPRRLARA